MDNESGAEAAGGVGDARLARRAAQARAIGWRDEEGFAEEGWACRDDDERRCRAGGGSGWRRMREFWWLGTTGTCCVMDCGVDVAFAAEMPPEIGAMAGWCQVFGYDFLKATKTNKLRFGHTHAFRRS
jgi:hypothetical protein